MADNQTRRQQLANFYLRSGHELDKQLDRPFPENIKILSDGGQRRLEIETVRRIVIAGDRDSLAAGAVKLRQRATPVFIFILSK